jgi:Mg2+ and Co2+ transporter CorA
MFLLLKQTFKCKAILTVYQQTLGMASTPGKAHELPRDHFTGLHNLAKHTTYLRENCDSALATLQGLRQHHASVIGDHPEPAQQFTRQALEYRKTLFQSTQRRLGSLDKRMSNIIQLSFNLVTQGDSRLMQSENQSMKTIAVMTLIFMPLGTIAGIFGTQFMKLDEDAPFHIRVSQDFWLMWIIAVPLTFIVVGIWRVWYHDARGRLIDDIPQRAKGERGWLGWKTMMRSRKRNVMRTDYEKAYDAGAAIAS